MWRFATFFFFSYYFQHIISNSFHVKVQNLRLYCLFSDPGRRWRGTRCCSDTCFTANTWSGCCATCGSATKTPGSTRCTRPSGESTDLLAGVELRACLQTGLCSGLPLRSPCASGCSTSCRTSSTTWCLRWWSPPGTSWRTTWRRWGFEYEQLQNGRRFLFSMLSLRSRSPGFEHRRRPLPSHQLPG